jgi:galactitol-specific phosphotransferase system IIB component
MKQTIAIEPGLTSVKDFLSSKGYDVQSISFSEVPSNDAQRYDAFVVTGINRDFMGMSDTNSKAVVIEAKGMTPEQVYSELQSRLH